MQSIKIFTLALFIVPFLHAGNVQMITLAKSLNLSAGSKAIVQWERVFKSERKMKRYNIDRLTPTEQDALKEYLIEHAIDSDQPTIAGV